jgi:hypothetical protein
VTKRAKTKVRIRSRTIATSGLTIWLDLKFRGGLDLQRPRDAGTAGYDLPLEEKLNTLLFPSSKGSLETNLRAVATPPEDFFAAFFSALRPFSMMVHDVLELFEAANARYGDRNMKIVFNFKKGAELGVELKHFRETEQYLSRVTRPIHRWQWSGTGLFNINRQLPRRSTITAMPTVAVRLALR